MEANSPKSPSPTIKSPSPPNPLKRKDPPEDQEQPSPPPSSTKGLPEGAVSTDGEYSSGHVVCDYCGTSVPFRDEQTDAFTTKIWDDHRIACGAQAPPAGDAIIYTPESTAEALAHPAPKRRRAKRSEEERIDYLKNDPYVAQFEAYRVLCASCDKWIRLRPNSTYCSIPWDAHRKSCLAKKINSKNIYALEERNTLLSKDPDVRKFDAERVLCNLCDRWITVNPDDHLQAVQKWLEHRASCQKAHSIRQVPVRDPAPAPHAADHPKAGPSSAQSSTPTSITSPVSPEIASISTQPTLRLSQSQSHSPTSFHDLTPNNYAPAHESRRRNAEQRAATLRADNLIGKVEPNRVFCSLCQKWVQLRQDSSYCAYPWLQHRGKCLARHQRRAQKAAEIARLKARRQQIPGRDNGQDELISDNDMEDDVESEDGADSQLEDDIQSIDPRRTEQEKMSPIAKPRYIKMARPSIPYHHHPTSQRKSHSFYHSDPRGQPSTSHSHSHPHAHSHPYLHPHSHSHSHPHPGPTHSSSRPNRPWKVEEVDSRIDVDADSYPEDEHRPHHSASYGPVRRPKPTGLADLDSPSGRKQFIFSSVHHLFATTYEASDDLSISALLTYLNAAVPMDKHEDFDTSEVIKAVAALQDKGRIRFEGDMLRLVE